MLEEQAKKHVLFSSFSDGNVICKNKKLERFLVESPSQFPLTMKKKAAGPFYVCESVHYYMYYYIVSQVTYVYTFTYY